MRTARRVVAGALGVVLVVGTTALAPATADPDDGSSNDRASGDRASGVSGDQPDLTGSRVVAREDAPVGEWTVRRLDDGSYAAQWTSPEPLPVTSDQPHVLDGDRDLGPALVSTDGLTATLAITATTEPDPADLDLVVSGRSLDDPAPIDPGPAGPSAAPDLGDPFAVDPGDPGPYDTATSDYELAGFHFPGMPEDLEMVGHVVAPAEGEVATDVPVVMFLHGRHQWCYNPSDPEAWDDWPCAKPGSEPIPSQLGYDYIQELLASQGYYTVSIAANGINGQDGSEMDGGAAARAELIERHLDHLDGQAAGLGLDMSQVVLVGHSRGGEGVNRASVQIGLDAPYTIAGQVLIAPTNFARQTAAYVPTVTMLPYCDGDVIDLQGQQYTDISRGLAEDDTSLKSSVLVMGANHNFFNTEWTPGISAAPSSDDWGGPAQKACGAETPSRLTAGEQQSVGAAYVAGAAQLFTGEDAMLPLFDGTAGHVDSTGDAQVLSTTLGAGRELKLPDLDVGVGASTSEIAICGGYAGWADESDCGFEQDPYRAPHWRPKRPKGIPTFDGVEMTWDQAGENGVLPFTESWDLSGATSVDVRTVVDPAAGDPDLEVWLVDEDGVREQVTDAETERLEKFPGKPTFALAKLLAQNLRVPLAGLTQVDLTRISAIELVGADAAGHLWVLDIAGVPGGPLPVVPPKRLPQVDLGNVTQLEGDTPPGVVNVDYTVRGVVTEPATFVVTVEDWSSRKAIAPVTVELEPGDEGGVVPVSYTPNTVDDQKNVIRMLTALPVHGVMPRLSNGRAITRDDDPAPAARIRAVRGTVREGKPVKVTITLDEPTGYGVYTYAPFVKGPAGPRMTVGDLPKRWAVQHFETRDPKAELWGQHAALSDYARAGRTRLVLTMPTKADNKDEGTEQVTLRVKLPQLKTTKTVTVFVRD